MCISRQKLNRASLGFCREAAGAEEGDGLVGGAAAEEDERVVRAQENVVGHPL